MKTTALLLLCKLLSRIGRLIGKGSSLPGRIALRLDPGILSRIRLPEYVAAVTGSNGKTSTVEMIAHVLRQSGRTVAYNREGSNQIEGIATVLLNDCDWQGRVRSDIVLLESDERFARHTFRYFTPTHYVITNLYRDQLTRNGHPEWVYDILRESIHDGTRLILNADDPLVSCFGDGREGTVWFGVERTEFSEDANSGVYDDGRYCPRCKSPMRYDYYHFNHIGKYRCTGCGLARRDPDFAVTQVGSAQEYIVVNGKYRIDMAFPGIYHCYNALAAFSLCSLLGVSGEETAAALNGYLLRSGRVVTFRLGDRRGTLLASKHENSVSYDQSIRVAVQDPRGVSVLIFVDSISRKYFTSETSWLWDIDFERLNAPNIREILLAGRYCADLAVRFSHTGIPESKLFLYEDIAQAVRHFRTHGKGYLYVITCFSDKGKFLETADVEKEDMP